MSVDIGTATSIAFGTSNFAGTILSVNGTDITRPAIKTSHLGTTTWDTFIPGDLTDPGGVDLEMAFEPQTAIQTTKQPPITAAAETVTITFPIPVGGATAATFSASGFATSWNWTAPLEDMMTASATIKFSGAQTWTDGTV